MPSPLQPLQLQTKLADTPKLDPKYSVKIQLANGQSIQAACPRSTRAMVSLMDMNAVQGGAASHYGGPAALAELMSATHALMFHASQQAGKPWHELYHFVNDAGHCENGLYALKANYGFAGLQIADLKKFRSIESKLTGHGEAHLFPEGVLVSNGPLGSGIPQAQGLGFADSLKQNRRTTICVLSDGGAMEGEAKEALAAIPGLARKGKMAPFVCVVSDNKTKLSGRIEQDSFMMEPTFASMETQGWKVLRLDDGHNLQACVTTIEEALRQVQADPSVPVLIHARTIKGKGVKKCETSSSGAHGFPLKSAKELPEFLSEIYDGAAVPAEFSAWVLELVENEVRKTSSATATASSSTAQANATSAAQTAATYQHGPSEKIQAGIASAMIKARAEGLPVFSVSADLQGSTGVADFHKAYPDSVLDVGVAESNMISTAIGLSLSGYIPVVDTFAQFGVTKGALPLTMASLSQAPVIGVFSHTGFQDAADGASHQALSFFAQVSSIPHVETYALSCSAEADALMTQALKSFASERAAGRVPPTRIFFLGRENFPRTYGASDVQFHLGKATLVRETLGLSASGLAAPAAGTAAENLPGTSEASKSVTIVAFGSMLGEALKASQQLLDQGIACSVIHSACINHPDVATIQGAIAKTGGRLITVEEHRLVGGAGAMLTHALMLAKSSGGSRAADVVNALTVRSLGVGDHFGQSAYSALELYKMHGLDSGAITKAAKEICG